MEKVDQDMNNEIILQQCSKLESIEFTCLYTNSYRFISFINSYN